jgi:hypothetical protein
MSFGEILQRLQERGITQTRDGYGRDAQGRLCDPEFDFHAITSVCVIGALRYACTAGWITNLEKNQLCGRLWRVARRHGYKSLIHANDAGVSFDTFAAWETQAVAEDD